MPLSGIRPVDRRTPAAYRGGVTPNGAQAQVPDRRRRRILAGIGRWTGRVLLLLAMVAFASLAVVFGIVTFVAAFGPEPIEERAMVVLIAALVVVCVLVAAGAWFLFFDTFR